jgi:hypothetical protein
VTEAVVPLSRLVALNAPEAGYAVLGVAGAVLSGLVSPASAFVLSYFLVVLYETAPVSELGCAVP